MFKLDFKVDVFRLKVLYFGIKLKLNNKSFATKCLNTLTQFVGFILSE